MAGWGGKGKPLEKNDICVTLLRSVVCQGQGCFYGRFQTSSFKILPIQVVRRRFYFDCNVARDRFAHSALYVLNQVVLQRSRALLAGTVQQGWQAVQDV